ncbi:hypothetical protein HPB50_005234 [Hyalomma asiaticum]|uniref:Uncharacterized protein n=1 Tax=Hyalomma asiaticum TaxID=266040 RepID=A0ACB7SEM7_HYAAI|nr:hypothetical protein HPB50_005234 [Hyalomma asiaticum]
MRKHVSSLQLFTKNWDGPRLYEARLAEKFAVERQEPRWPMLFVTLLPAVGLGLVLLLAYMALERSPKDTATVANTIAVATRAGIVSSEIPTTNQLAWQKAAAMYKACVSFASSYLPETIELVKWMISMDLDFINTTRLLSVNPVEVMVRGSLDLGVEALISIRFDKTKFTSGKRVMLMDYSKEQDVWLQKRSLNWLSTILSDYSLYFLMYGMRRKDVYGFAGKIRRFETELEYIAKGAIDWEKWEYVSISKLGEYTVPHVTSGQWGAFFSKYTNGTYTEHDKIVHFLHSTRIIQKLYESEYVGADGLRYLVAWGIYRQLAEFTEPYLFRGERSAEDSCYVHVKNVMNLAVINRYFLMGFYINTAEGGDM